MPQRKINIIIVYIIITFLFLYWFINAFIYKEKFELSEAEEAYLKEKENTLVFIGDVSYPPFSFMRESELIGYEQDLVLELENLLNINIRYLQIPWTDAIKALDAGTVDVITGMKVTPARQEKYLFTKPYLFTTQSIIAPKSLKNTPALKTLSEYRVIVQENSYTHDLAKQNKAKEIITVVNTSDGWKSLASENGDLWLENSMTALYYLRKNNIEAGYKSYLLEETSGHYAMAISNNNRLLTNILNKALHELELNGAFTYLDNKWFGTKQHRPFNEYTEAHFIFIILYLSFTAGFIHFIWNNSLAMKLDKRTKELQEAKRIIEERKNDMQSLLDQIANSFATTIDYRDMYTGFHSKRVAEISSAIAQKLKLSEEEVLQTYVGALIHDVGKVGIPDAILNKIEPLTENEYNTIQKHPIIGSKILEHIKTYDIIKDIVRYHHERWDGRTEGQFAAYPGEVYGNLIPLPARIVAVADAFDAMTSDRPYRKALSMEEAISKIKAEAGLQFDPDVVKSFLSLLKYVDDYTIHIA